VRGDDYDYDDGGGVVGVVLDDVVVGGSEDAVVVRVSAVGGVSPALEVSNHPLIVVTVPIINKRTDKFR
jgi:hypothetical protein